MSNIKSVAIHIPDLSGIQMVKNNWVVELKGFQMALKMEDSVQFFIGQPA
jgi:hypothetical protein